MVSLRSFPQFARWPVGFVIQRVKRMRCFGVSSMLGSIGLTIFSGNTLVALAQTPTVNLPELTPTPSATAVTLPQVTPVPNATPVDRPQLSLGDQGPLVQQLQFYLKELGYFSEQPNGVFGESTAAAIRTLQERRGLPRDGVMNSATWGVLITDYQIKNFNLGTPPDPQVDLPAPTPSPQASNVALSLPATPDQRIAQADLKALSLPPEIDRPNTPTVTLPDPTATPNPSIAQAQALDQPNPEPPPAQSSSKPGDLVIRAVLGVVLLALGSFFLLKLLRILRKGSPQSPTPAHQTETPNTSEAPLQTLEIVPNAQPPQDGQFSTEDVTAITYPIHDRSSLITPELATPEFARMVHRDEVEELISQLSSDQVSLRRQAVWELGQKADSRALKPLMELFPVADSQEQSLILGAISEISTKTLKPMKQALAMSLDSPNPEVRKNAIRDLQRLYEMVSQASQLIKYALNDPDPEVQETAQWAIEQMERLNRANTHRQLK